MNRNEYATLQMLNEKLSQVFDTLESQSDSDLDFFESDDEEREGAPCQWAAKNIFEIQNYIEEMLDGYGG